MKTKAFLARICLLSVALASQGPIWAQAPSTAASNGPVLAPGEDPAALLAENLKALARDPYNVDALIAAGSGALAVGDANAAFGFFARAEELSPSNWRAKAGLASSLTMMERSRDALRVFDEALSLGAPEQAIVADRGLAYDLEGEGKKAQRDYQAALKSAPSDEVIRRYALSQGIVGEKEAALARLDPLVRRNDQGAWRARAFILAMNGDLPGAERIVRMVAPSESAGAMLGFMQRLTSLNAAAKAHAVHFGSLPASGESAALVEEDAGFNPLDASLAARLDTPDAGRATGAAATSGDARDARRTSRQERDAARLAERSRRTTDTALASPAPEAPPVPTSARAAAVSPVNQPTVSAAPRVGPPAVEVAVRAPNSAGGSPASAAPASAKAADLPALFEVPPAPPRREPAAAASTPVRMAAPPAVATPATPAPSETKAQPDAARASVTAPVAPRFVLADVVRTLELEPESQPIALPDEARLKARRIAAQKKAAAEAKARAEKAEADRRAAEEAAKARRNPARVWVQIATGGNMAGLQGTWRSIRSKAPDVLGDMKAWYVPFRQTNRIVVGPVKSTSEARKIVNDLAKQGVTATLFSSEAGQEVERIGGK